MNKGVLDQVFSLSARVRKEAAALDKLPGSALAAVLGGSVVIGVAGGGLFWIPAAMSGAMFLYRSAVTAIHYRHYKAAQGLQIIDEGCARLDQIARNQFLSAEQKQELSSLVLAQIPVTAGQPVQHSVRALEHQPAQLSHSPDVQG